MDASGAGALLCRRLFRERSPIYWEKLTLLPQHCGYTNLRPRQSSTKEKFAYKSLIRAAMVMSVIGSQTHCQGM